ncbi:MAG: S-adenosylmethionine:tRNA ribosyltransferase-isomerase [Acidobacteriota bacterium]
MTPATLPIQRPAQARLLVLDAEGAIRHSERSRLVDVLRPGDLVVANDAATLPGSLFGHRERSGQERSGQERSGQDLEIRLAGRRSLDFDDTRAFTALALGAGDHRTPTEHRPEPPELSPGDRLILGPLRATVEQLLGHPRWLTLAFEGDQDEVWAGIASHGRPIQYAHVPERLALWDVWTRVAAMPVAFEPPSAGFVLDWQLLASLQKHRIDFATLTHAAGISSTGDPELDRRLPIDEPYRIPQATVDAIARARAGGGRVVALGTTVARALEHAATLGELRAGNGVATQRIGADSELRLVDVLLSGVHEPGESHYELLRAFAARATLERMSAELEANDYRNHEFGDSVLIERQPKQLAADSTAASPRALGWGSKLLQLLAKGQVARL